MSEEKTYRCDSCGTKSPPNEYGLAPNGWGKAYVYASDLIDESAFGRTTVDVCSFDCLKKALQRFVESCKPKPQSQKTSRPLPPPTDDSPGPRNWKDG